MCSQTQVKSLCFLVDFSFRFVFLQNSHIITIQNKRICRILINNIYFLKTSHVYVLFSSSSFRIYLDFFIFFSQHGFLVCLLFLSSFFFPIFIEKESSESLQRGKKKRALAPSFWSVLERRGERDEKRSSKKEESRRRRRRRGRGGRSVVRSVGRAGPAYLSPSLPLSLRPSSSSSSSSSAPRVSPPRYA